MNLCDFAFSVLKGSIVLLGLVACQNADSPQMPQNEPQNAPLETLLEGNARLADGHPLHPDESLKRLRALQYGQQPFAVVLSCSDSRVPPELIFDQGFGDIFSIRTAGNVIGDYELGSIEYAVKHLNCKLVMVLGHHDCGALKAFLEADGHYEHHDHIKNIINYLEAESEEQLLVKHDSLNLNNAIKANVRHGVHVLSQSEPILKPLVTNQKLKVVGAVYNFETRTVELL